MSGPPNIHRGVPTDVDTDGFQWCENCGDGYAVGDPMIDVDGQSLCSARCLREYADAMSDGGHGDLVAAHRSFADRLAAIMDAKGG